MTIRPAVSQRLSIHLLAGLLLAAMIAPPPARASQAHPIVALDQAIAETLLELGIAPVMISQRDYFDFWTDDAYDASQLIEVGQPLPNIELLRQVSPRQILLAPWQAAVASQLDAVAPIEIVDDYPYSSEGDIWIHLLAFTRQLGQQVGRPQAAAHLIQQTETHLDALRNKAMDEDMPLLIVQLMDQRHVRVFGGHSLPQGVLQRLGLHNAWHGATNQWGYALVGIDSLFDIEARLVVIRDPFPTGIEQSLTQNGLWRHLPSVQHGDIITLTHAFWFAGGLPSARRFADALVEALGDD